MARGNGRIQGGLVCDLLKVKGVSKVLEVVDARLTHPGQSRGTQPATLTHESRFLRKQKVHFTMKRWNLHLSSRPSALWHSSTSSQQQNEHEWRKRLCFKTRSPAGMWWVRTSVSEESLRAPSLALRREKAMRLGVRMMRRVSLPLEETQNKWLITVLRAQSAPRLLETGGCSAREERRCQSVHHALSLQVAFHHAASV